MKTFTITLAMLLTTSTVLAEDASLQDREQIAKKLFKQGQAAYQAGNYQSAADFYTRSIQNSASADATASLCGLYYRGEGVDQVFSVALQFCKIAASKKSSIAMTTLGKMYLQGNGVKMSTEKARDYFQQASTLGNKDAQSLLAKMDQPNQP